MSLFPSALTGGDFTPLFRLLDDYDSHRSGTGRHASIQTFQPRFDVREVKDAYELHGELPGIDQKDVTIEFTDPNTLVIKGRVERSYTSGTPSSAIEGATTGRITSAEDDHHHSHKATVEDDPSETAQASTSATNTSTNTQVQHHAAPKQPRQHQGKFWVAERSVGEFHRSFSFPHTVDQDHVKASLKNGILSVLIPKATARQARKITIE